MFRRSRELPVPQEVDGRRDAIELVRVWDVGGNAAFTLQAPHWDDPAAWGLLLADLARQAAAAYTEHGWAAGEALARVKDGLAVELDASSGDT